MTELDNIYDNLIGLTNFQYLPGSSHSTLQLAIFSTSGGAQLSQAFNATLALIQGQSVPLTTLRAYNLVSAGLHNYAASRAIS